ncbi:MAG: 30S ribosomal protein S2 [Candidatus Marsarchaeota archaeon]|nr:30S ribosomal protein S2 [Candidatus Marsarchaeota archaeon]
MTNGMLVDQNEYLEVGIHIGTKVKTPGMKRFIYKVRDDGLYLLDLPSIDKRLGIAARMLSRYNPEDIVITASRIYSIAAAAKFAEITGVKLMKGRVMPGVFTNPNRGDFVEPEIVLVSDNRNERQAVKEASKTNIPVMALCDTDNWIKDVDFIIPCNNKGRRSLSLIYFLLAREFMKEKGLIKSNDEFNYKVSDFEAKIEMKAK